MHKKSTRHAAHLGKEWLGFRSVTHLVVAGHRWSGIPSLGTMVITKTEIYHNAMHCKWDLHTVCARLSSESGQAYQ